jgi:hypothetical protein
MNKNIWNAEIRSLSEETGHSVFVQMRIIEHQNKVVLILPCMTQGIPLGYIFYIYGFSEEEWEKILRINVGQKRMEAPIVKKIIENIKMEYNRFNSKEECMEYISKYSIHIASYSGNRENNKNISYIYQVLYTEIFPHLGIESLRGSRGMFLGHMLSKIVMVMLGERSYDDRDHINNKRLETSGYLLSELFRTLYKRFFRSLEPLLLKRCDILVVISKLNIITQGIQHCFLTGNWGFPKSSYIRTGVSQILNRLSYNATLSHLRRILIPIGKEGKNTKIRQVHPSQIGFICPHETPEGHCIIGDCLVQCGDGYWKYIKDIRIEKVECIDLKQTRRVQTRSNYKKETEQNEIYKITLINGLREIECTALHKILVWQEDTYKVEWKYAKDIDKEKDKIGVYLTRCPIYWKGSENEIKKYRVLGLLYGVYQNREKIFLDKDRIEGDMRAFLIENEDYNWREGETMEITQTGRRKCHEEIDKVWKKSIHGEEAKYREFLSTFFISQKWNIWEHSIPMIRSIQNRIDWDHELNSMRYIQRWLNQIGIGKWELIQVKHELQIELRVAFQDLRERIKCVEYIGYCYNGSTEKNVLNECFMIFEGQEDIQRVGDIYMGTIESIKIEKGEYRKVYDIGVEHTDHNFIANGIIVHNSAGIVKNMTNVVQYTPRIDSRYIRLLIEDIEEINCSICHAFSIRGFQRNGFIQYSTQLS